MVGIPGGATAQMNLGAMMLRRVTLKGTVLRARPAEEKAVLTGAFEERLLPFFSSGEMKPVIHRVFPPEDAAVAHDVMAANENFGKLLIKVADE